MKFFLILVILIVPSLTNSEQMLKNVVRKAYRRIQGLDELVNNFKEFSDEMGTGKCSQEQFVALAIDIKPCKGIV